MKRSLLVVLGLAMAACSPAPDAASTKSAIAAANARYIDAFKRGDKAVMAASFTDDAIVMVPNEPSWRGKAGVEKGVSDFVAHFSFKDGGIQTEDIVLAGDLAVETGTYVWTFQAKSGGGEIKDRGKYLTVWRHQPDGSWKILRDINNSDIPLK